MIGSHPFRSSPLDGSSCFDCGHLESHPVHAAAPPTPDPSEQGALQFTMDGGGVGMLAIPLETTPDELLAIVLEVVRWYAAEIRPRQARSRLIVVPTTGLPTGRVE